MKLYAQSMAEGSMKTADAVALAQKMQQKLIEVELITLDMLLKILLLQALRKNVRFSLHTQLALQSQYLSM